jgi:ribosomal protein L24
MAIKENATVKVIGGFYEGRTGKVARLYPDLNTATVAIDGVNRLVKIRMDALEEVNVKIEIPEGAKRITKEEFITALQKVVSPEEIFSGSSNPLFAMLEGLAATMLGHKMVKTLFKDEDAVILTEDDLVGALWNTCDPVAIAKEGVDNHSAFDVMLISTSSVITLRDLVTILFGAEDGI